MRILITDSDNRQTLAATRTLGRNGHLVYTAGDIPKSLASASRWSVSHEVYPSPVRDPSGFVDYVVEMAARLDIELLLPMTEISTLLLTQARDRLPAKCRLPFPDHDTVATAANKAAVLRLAAQVGVPIPATVEIESVAHARTLADQFAYPVVLKSGRSRVWNGKEWLSTSVCYARDATDLITRLGAMPTEIFPVLAQERIDGPGVGVFLCCHEGRVVAQFAHRRIREKPPSGGQSVMCESVAVEPQALAQASRLLAELRWEGPAMVEFKRDLRDGSLKLMEINGRFWGSLQLAIDAGVDFPNLLVALRNGQPPREPPPYRIGVQSRWLWGDFDSLVAVLRRSPAELNLPASHPGRLHTLFAFLMPWRPYMYYEMERLSDLGPWWLETKRRLTGQAH
jgi:predicted ATP-grasp superfamily ATP-dependent carboligase